MYQLSQYYREHSNPYRALLWTERAILLHNSDTLSRQLAMCYYNRGYYQKALDLTREIIVKDTLETDLVLMSHCFEKMSMPDSLIEYQFKIARLNIENQSNLVNLVQNLNKTFFYETSYAILSDYCKFDSTNMIINGLMAQTMYFLKNYDCAISKYEQLLQDGDTRVNSYYYLGMAYFRNEIFDKAYYNLQIANDKSYASNPTILSNYGLSQLKYASLGEDGVNNVLKAIDLMLPDTVTMYTLYYNLADYYLAKYKGNDMQIALSYLDKVRDYKPDDNLLNYQYGTVITK